MTKISILAASIALALISSAYAQTPAGGGKTEGNMNNPGSVKSDSEKAMERSTGSATGGTAGTGTVVAPGGAAGAGAGSAVPMGGHSTGGGTSSSGAAR